MMANPLANRIEAPRSATGLQEFADYANDGFVAAAKRWFWFVTNSGKLIKFDINRLGTVGYVKENPERAKAYAMKVTDGNHAISDEIVTLAMGKPRPAIFRDDQQF